MNNCSPWIHEIYQGIFEICTDLGILVVNAKYAPKYTVAYTRFLHSVCVSVLGHSLFALQNKCEISDTMKIFSCTA